MSRPFIEAAKPEHPSLLDPTHQMDTLFGVVNIPNVVWIDEEGTIVRPAEPGWPWVAPPLPEEIFTNMDALGRAPNAPEAPEGGPSPRAIRAAGQDRATYAEAIRDWARNGAESIHALSPDEVVERSQPRPITASEGAAHFELANHLWRAGRRELAIAHFNACHRLQPDNWTYKRQAYSLVGNERAGGRFGRYIQGPAKGEEADWPFDSDYTSDVSMLAMGEYYPKTLETGSDAGR
ncbi:MAG: hypothetical protein NVSMB29_20020 [Candidatus Dormibacteria bacterium]